MALKLVNKKFEFSNELTDFVNKNNIKQEDIQSISSLSYNGDYWWYLFYWTNL